MTESIPWYWDYKYLESSDRHRTDRSSVGNDHGFRTSVFGGILYYHCRDCNRGFATIEGARGCCGEERRQRDYEARQAVTRQLRRFHIALDTTSLVHA